METRKMCYLGIQSGIRLEFDWLYRKTDLAVARIAYSDIIWKHFLKTAEIADTSILITIRF